MNGIENNTAEGIALQETRKKPANGLRQMAAGRKEILLFAPDKLTMLDGFNFRGEFGRTPEDIQLVKAFVDGGQDAVDNSKALIVFHHDDKICVADGHRTLSAVLAANSQGANIETVRCEVRKLGLLEAKLLQITANLGVNPSPMELALIAKQLEDGIEGKQLSRKEIASALGVTEAQVSNYILMTGFPAKVQERIKNNEIASTLVVEAFRKLGDDETKPEKLQAIVEKAIDKAKLSGKSKATKKHIELPAENKTKTEGETTTPPQTETKKKEFIRSEVGPILRLALKGLRDESDDDAVRDEAAAAVAAFIEENGF